MISDAPYPKEYTKSQQTALANELDEKCPVGEDKYGNETRSCPMIDQAINDYGELRKVLRTLHNK